MGNTLLGLFNEDCGLADVIIAEVLAAPDKRTYDLTPCRAELRQLIEWANEEFRLEQEYRDPAQRAEIEMYQGPLRFTGRPSANLSNPAAPPPILLRDVYRLAESWWKRHVKPTFYPRFNRPGDPPNWPDCNASARLLHLLVQDCHHGYTLINTKHLTDTMKR
jgi:hypothetical protein